MTEREWLDPEEKLTLIESIVQENPEVAGLQAYEYFRSNVAEQKSYFINDGVQLKLTYAALTLDNIQRLNTPMLNALRALMSDESTDKTESLFSAIEYRYSELFLMDLSRRILHGENEDPEVLKWFKDQNEALYGKPEQEQFNALAKRLILDKSEPNQKDELNVALIKREVLTLVGEIGSSDYEPFVPDDELLGRLGSIVHELYDGLVDHIDPDITYDVENIKLAMQTALDKIGGQEYGWAAEIVPDSTDLSTSAHQRKIEVGVNRKAVSGSKLRELTIHEVGVHAWRSINALKAGWLSAAYGQDGYLNFEEALGRAMEFAYSGKFVNSGEDYYLLAGLAYGLDSHAPRDFKGVFDVMRRADALARIKNGQLSDESIAKAKDLAFNRCVRFFRGTPMNVPGLVYLKDLSYFKGREIVWNVLKEVNTKEDLLRLMAGKLDNSREDHDRIGTEILTNLGWA